MKKILLKLKKEYKKRSKDLLKNLFKSSYSGSGLEFDSLTDSDLKNAKFIHWPSLAKFNELIYKKFEEEKNINIVLAIDEILVKNKHYFLFLLNIKKEILKLFPEIKKKILLLRKGKLIDMRNTTALYKILNEEENKKIKINSLKTKNSIVLIVSDFLDKDWDMKKLKKAISDSSLNSEFFFIVFYPKYDFYFGLDWILIKKLREKIKEKTKTLNRKFVFEV